MVQKLQSSWRAPRIAQNIDLFAVVIVLAAEGGDGAILYQA